MDYQLAKELKDAGFKGLVTAWESPRGSGMSTQPAEGWDEVVLPPTLEELIDACVKLSPDGDFHLEHLMHEWGASTCAELVSEDEWHRSATPTVAVAKLWLALNKAR